MSINLSDIATDSNCPLKPEFLVLGHPPKDFMESRYAAWVGRAFAACLLDLHDHLGIGEPFAVGFDFMAKKSYSDERNYLINPLTPQRTHRFRKSSPIPLLVELAGLVPDSEVLSVLLTHYKVFSARLKIAHD